MKYARSGSAQLILLVALLFAISYPSGAQAAEQKCVVTAYEFTSASQARKAAKQLEDRQAYESAAKGIALNGLSADDAVRAEKDTHWVFVIDSTEPLGAVKAELSAFGGYYSNGEFRDTVGENRLVVGPWEPAVARSSTLSIDADGCHAQVRLVAPGSAWSSIPGVLGLILALIFGTVAVFYARRIVGNRFVNTMIALPLAVAAGFGEALVLYETGVAAPTSRWPLWFAGLVVLVVLVLAALPQPRRIKKPKPVLPPPPSATPPRPTVPVGSMLGRYKLQTMLGQGATGVTYRALDPANNTLVALKVLAPRLCQDPGFVERFYAEAETMRRLTDPHCTQLRDFLNQPGAMTIVTDYIDGVSLRELLKNGQRLTGEQALGVFRGALTGLVHLHGHGLIHRDVKPDNIMLDRTGTTRLIDFGLTRPAGRVGEMVEGSPSYMSPELIRNKPLDVRSDVYACGMVLAELLTGRRIFAGKNLADTISNHVRTPVPDFTAEYGVAPALSSVIATAIAKDPDERYPSAADFLHALETAATEVFGPDWLSRAGVASLVTALAGAAVTSGALGAGATVATDIVGQVTPSPAPDLGTGSGSQAIGDVAGAGSASLGTKLVAASKVALGTVAAAAVAATAIVASPAVPAAPRPAVITPEQARVVFDQTWTSIEDVTFAGHVAESAYPAVEALYGRHEDLGISVVELHLPKQTSYPASFIVYADLLGNGEENGDKYDLLLHFTRASEEQAWLLTGLVVYARAGQVPEASVDKDGFVVPEGAGELRKAAASVPGEYAEYLENGVNLDQRDSVLFAPGPYTTETIPALRARVEQNRAGGVNSDAHFLAGDLVPYGVIEFADGASMLIFTVKGTFRSSNSADSWSGVPCTDGFIAPLEGWAGIPDGDYRSFAVEETFLVAVHAPKPKGGELSDIDVVSTAAVAHNPTTAPC
ncbi:MAG: serine/threonine protein kinase [Corynebacteriales bacterium]|nr:serine/threonine protein kinase [Mycobacteriales bacterium]